MSTYTTATDDAAAIRAELKRHGWNSRDVSVRSDYFSGGSSIDLTIKNPDVPAPTVKRIAEQKERIHRCEITGEILAGANRYVHVRYSENARKALAARYLPVLEDAAAKITDNYLLPIGETGFLVGFGRWGKGHGFALWGEQGHVCECFDLPSLAVELAGAIQRKAENAE